MLKIRIGRDPRTDGDLKLESSHISNQAHNGKLILRTEHRPNQDFHYHYNGLERFCLNVKFLHFNQIDSDLIDGNEVQLQSIWQGQSSLLKSPQMSPSCSLGFVKSPKVAANSGTPNMMQFDQ